MYVYVYAAPLLIAVSMYASLLISIHGNGHKLHTILAPLSIVVVVYVDPSSEFILSSIITVIALGFTIWCIIGNPTMNNKRRYIVFTLIELIIVEIVEMMNGRSMVGLYL